MKKFYKTNRFRELLKPLATLFLILVLLGSSAIAQNTYLNETFNTNPSLTQWTVDRYAPAAFVSDNSLGSNVLKISIDGTNDGAQARSATGQGGTFYNTQGRAYSLTGLNVTVFKGSLYLPSDWATKHRRSDMWATAFDATNTISAYPIIGFRNVDGQSPTFSCYDVNTGLWINYATPTTYDTWYNFEIRLVGSNVEYYMNGNLVSTLDNAGSTYLGNIIMQAYNFNDAALGTTINIPATATYDNSVDNSYDAYWDNVITQSNIYNVNQTTYYPTIPAAVSAATANDVIQVAAGTYDFTSQMNINIPVSIIGQSGVIFNANNAAWSTTNGYKHLFGIYAGTSVNPVTISNVTMNFNSQCYGLNTYNNAYGVLNGVTINGSKGAGLTVNGSTVTATNLTTATNAWGAVNVDPGSGVTTPSVFTLNSGTLAENNQIWSDGSYVTGSATVTVNATGYNKYKSGTVTIWTNRPLTHTATITTSGETSIYSTIQAAIDAAVTGDVINVYPGNYSETAANRYTVSTQGTAGPYQFGLYFPVAKPGITVRGVDASGNPITNYANVLASVTTNATNSFGESGIFVNADNITIQGLKILDNVAGYGNNKTVEIIGNNFTMKYCHVDIADGGSIYFNDWSFASNTSTQTKYNVTGNNFAKGCSVDICNGTGFTGPVSDRVIADNVFSGAGCSWQLTWGAISFNGLCPSVAWFAQPVGAATISGNTFTDYSKFIIRSRGTVDASQFNWQNYWDNNTFANKVITLTNPSTFTPRSYSYTSNGSTFTDVVRIGGAIQQDITDVAQAGDTIKVGAGTYTGNINLNKNISLLSVNGAATTIIDGNNSGSEFGAIHIPTEMNGITIGSVGHGFTIKGINGDGAIEKAAIYLRGTQNNINIVGNIIEARGDAGLQGEYNAINNNILIDNNQFTGQTFTGSNPSGVGFATQFIVGNNCPRQFVVFGGGASTTNTQNFTFTNNTISGISGGMSITNNAGGAISPTAQGNNMVTLDLLGTNIITGNTWSGSTTNAAALRVRGNGTYTINYNSFTGIFPTFITRSGATVNATCNWYGTTDATTIAAKISGSANFLPFNSTSTGPCNGLGPVVNTTLGTSYMSIQPAINAANAGDVITVAAGTYEETSISVNKVLTLNGPNAGLAGNNVSRTAEARISNTSISVTAAAVIDGFEIYQTNNTADAILVQAAATIKNSVIRREGIDPGQNVRGIVTAVSTSGFILQDNLFTGSTSGGLYGGHKTWNSGLYLNGGTGTISGNTFENCRTAINADDYNAGISISGNTFQNSGTYIAFGGTSPTNGQYVFGANDFKTLGTFINLSNVNTAFRLDITSSTLNGAAFNTLPLATLYQIEAGMYHRGRSGTKLGLITFVAGNQYVITGLTTIQSAIDYGTAGDIINVYQGTYAENVNVNKYVSIIGAGNTTIVQGSTGNAFTYTAAGSGTSASSRATLKNLKVNTSARGIYAQELVNYLTIDGVTFDGTTSYGIHINNTSGTMNDWTINNSTFNANPVGIHIGMLANINTVVLSGCTFTNNTSQGMYAAQSSSTPGGFNNVTISNCTFTNNGNANNNSGLYFEKLSNAQITGNTFTNNGLASNARAMIINLKYANYSNISITSNTLIENRGVPGNGYGMQIAGRNDAPSYNSVPASLSNLTISSNEITGFRSGIGFENNVNWNTTTVTNNKFTNCYTAMYASLANTSLTMNVHDNSFTGNTYNISNGVAGNTINATCNWFGTTNASTIASTIFGTVTSAPFLTSGTDSDIPTMGFQPVAGSCDGMPLTVTLTTHTDVSCEGLHNGSIKINITGGSYPYDVSVNGGAPDQTTLAAYIINNNGNGLYAGSYTITVTDANGSVGTLNQVIGTSNYPPILPTITDINTAITTGCTAIASYDATPIAGTAPFTTSYTFTGATTGSGTGTGTGATFNKGTTGVTVTTSNFCASVSTSFNVVVVDDIHPTFTCPSNQTVSLNNPVTTPINYKVSGTTLNPTLLWDNCTGYTISNNYNNSNTLANATFNPGTTNVVWTITDASSNTTTCAFDVTVNASYSISGTVKYASNAGTNLDGVKLTLTGGPAPVTYTTTATGAYSFTGLSAGTYSIQVSPINNTSWTKWGGVNATDYLLMTRHVSNTVPLPANPSIIRIGANVKTTDPISGINIVDANLIKTSYISNNTSQFDLPKWIFVGSSFTSALEIVTPPAKPISSVISGITVSGNVTLNITGLCAGDVDRSYAPPTGTKAEELPNLKLISNGRVAIKDEITVPVRAQYNMEMGAISLILDYDANKLEITGITMPNQGDAAPFYAVDNNTVRIGWASLTPVKVLQGETVLNIHVRTKGNVADGLRFNLNVSPLSEIATTEGVVLKDASLSIAAIGNTTSSDMISVYPNPAKDVLNFEYLMDDAGTFRAELYNVNGSLVGVIENNNKLAGSYKGMLDISNLASGVYSLRTINGNTINNQKVIITK